MSKIKISFYALSGLFSLAMAATAMAKLTTNPALVQSFDAMGYPLFLMTILGVAYLIGIAAILQPVSDTLRQWGYAGFSVALVGAVASHILSGDPIANAVPGLFLLVILAVTVVLERLQRNP